MGVKQEKLTDRYAIYNGDCIEVMESLPNNAIDLSIYSPPFCGLYNYSSSERDLSNCDTPEQFMEHYRFVVKHLARMTKPGRMSAVHCADIPKKGACLGGGLMDLPGAIIRLHEEEGWNYVARFHIWKEPLGVRLRTMAKSLAHKQIVEDSTCCDCAAADYLLIFKNNGENKIPVTHEHGLMRYAGEREMPADILKYRGWTGKQTENRFSHWIWRQYASAFWDDIRIGRTLPYKEAKDPEDERHCHPLQLDVIERVCELYSNPNEVVFTPFMGVGSEVYGSLINGRRGMGVELKTAYYAQAVLNLEEACTKAIEEQPDLFAGIA